MATKLSRTAIILIAVSVAILSAAVVRAIFAVKDARHNREAMSEFREASQEIRQDMKDKLGSEDTVEGASAKAQQMQDAMGKTASKLTGDAAKSFRAGERLMGAMKEKVANYETAFKGFVSPGGSEPKSLTSETVIESRLGLLRAFEARNQEFADFLKTAEGAFRAELEKESFPPARIEETAKGFRDGGNFPTLIAIRATDSELCTVMTKYLTLLKTEWGKWKVNEEGAILFQNDGAADEFMGYAKQLQDIAARQAALQEKVLNARQQPRPSGKQSAVGGQ